MPQNELEFTIVNNILASIRYVEAFSSAKELLDHIYSLMNAQTNQDISRYISWMTIAGRDGALQLNNLMKSLEAFHKLLRSNPEVRPDINRNIIQNCLSRLNRAFPSIREIRNAIGHAGEIHKDEDTTREHANRKSSDSFSISLGGISGRTFDYNSYGKILSYELDDNSCELLKEILFELVQVVGEPP